MKIQVVTAQDSAELDKWFKDVDDILNKVTQPNRGRPPKPPGEVKTEVFHVRCTPAEKKEYQALKQYLDDQRKEQQETTK